MPRCPSSTYSQDMFILPSIRNLKVFKLPMAKFAREILQCRCWSSFSGHIYVAFRLLLTRVCMVSVQWPFRIGTSVEILNKTIFSSALLRLPSSCSTIAWRLYIYMSERSSELLKQKIYLYIQ